MASRTATSSTAIKNISTVAELDALAEHLRGRFVVQVCIDDDRRHTYTYRNASAAERCVERARARGQRAHVTLCQLLPVGVVTGLGVAP